MNNYNYDWKKYLTALLITAFIFVTSIAISNHFSNQKIESLRLIGDSISIDILSSDTQFDLLESSTCETVGNSTFSKELNALGERLAFAEKQRTNTEEIQLLKKQYTLLLIKDYILMKKISAKCEVEPIFVLYFYSNLEDCTDCTRQGHVLTYLREKYPQLRVYSFDYHLDLPALSTLLSINGITTADILPVLIIDDEQYKGFMELEDLEDLPLFEELQVQKDAEEALEKAEAEKAKVAEESEKVKGPKSD
jgi:hypothetical protein